MNEPNTPYRDSIEVLTNELKVSPDSGLDEKEALRRLQTYGKNRLKKAKPKSLWIILLNQIKNLIVLLLAIASALSFVLGDWLEGVAIVIVIVINSAIGFLTEIKAVRSMEALYRLVHIEASVRRGGGIIKLAAEDLVPGDIVILEAGDMVPADIRLFKASRFESDESSLTGESVPVPKQIEPLGEVLPVSERTNMVFMGTAVTRGSGEGVVTSTGVSTEIGNISVLVESAEDEKTPLDKNLNQLGSKLIWATLVVAASIIVIGILRGKEMFLMIETGIALAVAAIPEGLPVVATIALARGMMRMARRNALINKLSAVETLGSTNVICTDKTGTLTENKMSVKLIATAAGLIEIKHDEKTGENMFSIQGKRIEPLDDPVLKEVLEVGVLCNGASLEKDLAKSRRSIGDPLEIALLFAGDIAGIQKKDLLRLYPEIRVEAFDTSVNMMSTFHQKDGSFLVAVKGAPDSLLEISSKILTENGQADFTDELKDYWYKMNEELAGKGYRVIAHGEKEVESASSDPYEKLAFLGLVCLLDPPRLDVRDSILKCLDAGIKVVMVTGDHPATAKNIALAVGLVPDDKAAAVQGKDIGKFSELSTEQLDEINKTPILARVSPEQKLDIVSFKQGQGQIVAMTGDGVNDAPALKKADIGIAMGLRGTQVAREASDIVLKDDSFSTIVAAIEEGRIIFGNIRKFITYLISCNVSEIMIVSFASFAAVPLPILPLQILFLNLVTDVFPALALGMGEGGGNVMKLPPRDPQEPIMTKRNWIEIAGYGLIITISVLGALLLSLYYLGFETQKSVSVSFLTLAFVQLFHVFNMRDRTSAIINNEITRNLYVWGALFISAALILVAVYFPPVAKVLKVVEPGYDGWLLIICMSLIPLFFGQMGKLFIRVDSKQNISDNV